MSTRMPIVICRSCDAAFVDINAAEGRTGRRRTSCLRCSPRHSGGGRADRPCAVCAATFSPSTNRQVVCGKACAKERKRQHDRVRYQSDSYRAYDKRRNQSAERREYRREYWRLKEREAARERAATAKQIAMALYQDDPKRCAECSSEITWERRRSTRCQACADTRRRAAANEYTKRRYHEHTEVRAKMIGYAQTRRARMLGTALGPVSPLRVFERDGWRCQRLGCGVVTSLDLPRTHPRRAVLGHVVALATGGSHTEDNVVCLCHRCNCDDGVNRAAIQMGLSACE